MQIFQIDSIFAEAKRARKVFSLLLCFRSFATFCAWNRLLLGYIIAIHILCISIIITNGKNCNYYELYDDFHSAQTRSAFFGGTTGARDLRSDFRFFDPEVIVLRIIVRVNFIQRRVNRSSCAHQRVHSMRIRERTLRDTISDVLLLPAKSNVLPSRYHGETEQTHATSTISSVFSSADTIWPIILRSRDFLGSEINEA